MRIFGRRYHCTLSPTIHQILARPQLSGQFNVHGWVASVRHQKSVAFAQISDGTSPSKLQAVFNNPALAKGLTNGSSVRLTGNLVPSQGKGQDWDFTVRSIQVVGHCDPDSYPIQKKDQTVAFLRENAHLRARTDDIANMLRLRHTASRALESYFESQGFLRVHTPIITSNDCEGAGETFCVSNSSKPDNEHFFGAPAYLTVSAQLHLEVLTSSISRAYTLSPVFRAEGSSTSRHLSEFWMLEAEMAFCDSLDDIMSITESSIKHILQSGRPDGFPLRPDLESAASSERWERITYTDAVSLLEKNEGLRGRPPIWGEALSSEHEKWLAGQVGGPVFITHYPETLKPFYMRSTPNSVVECFDLLVPHVGELVGGSLREERLDMLLQALKKRQMSSEDYAWYLDLRRFGSTPHGGFGLGFERLIAWIGGWENVRECILAPRWRARLIL